jgi:hypothetical protein
MKASSLITILALLIFSFAPECKKKCGEEKFQSTGQIGDADLRKCSCCGGYFITINGEQYRFFTLPAGSGINLETDPRPVNVHLNWHKETEGPCASELIVIDAIRKM